MFRSLARLREWRPGGYLGATAGLFPWLLLRTLGQAVLVIALARLLGAAGYGRFVAVLAVASFFAPLAGLGLQGVLLRDGARHPETLTSQLRLALGLWLPAVILFSALGLALVLWVLPTPPPVFAVTILMVGEVAASSLVEISARVAQAQNKIGRYGRTLAGLILVRVAALALYALWWRRPDVAGWMWVYGGASLGYVVWLWVHIERERSPAHRATLSRKALLSQGWPFALGTLSVRLQGEFNKPVLADLGYGLAGNFSAAQRAVDVASLPLAAMQEALWPRLYASADPSHRMRFMRSVLMVLALLGGVLLYELAPWVPYFLGSGFREAAHLLQFLAALPVLQVLRNFVNFEAVSARRSHAIAGAYIAGALSSVTLNLWLIPIWGWAGAVIALYLTEIAVIAVHTGFRLQARWRAA